MKLKRLMARRAFVIAFFTLLPSQALAGFGDSIEVNPLTLTHDEFQKAAAAEKLQKRHTTVRVLALTDSHFSESSIEPFGWHCCSQNGNIAVLSGPKKTVPFLGVIDGIRCFQKPMRVFSEMDSARRLSYIDNVQGNAPSNLPGKYSGKGVLIGFLETEFDTHHPAFLDSTGKTRFIAIWDQTDSSKTSKGPFGYGVLETQQQLDADSNFALHGEIHGTWVEGMAAGSDRSCPYYGAAPGAILIGVKRTDEDNDIANGLRWICSVADSLNLPCVINMSIGDQRGPHDGTSLMDQVIDSISGNGRIVVGAAGNDKDKKVHAQITLQKGESRGTWVTPYVDSTDPTAPVAECGVDIWGKPGIPFNATLSILDSATMNITTIRTTLSTVYHQYSSTIMMPGTNDSLQFEAVTEVSSLNSKPHMEILIYGSDPELYLGVSLSTSSQSADTIHCWNMMKTACTSFGMSGYVDGDSLLSVNEVGGTAKRNITVGAYTSRLAVPLWNGVMGGNVDNGAHALTHYSSFGPTADGRTKPDIIAPGSQVVGPLNRTAPFDNSTTAWWPDYPDSGGRYAYTGGTSMATPIVAGIVAMMLQVNPKLSPDTARRILQETAYTDQYTDAFPTPNNFWGAGKVNALGAMQKMLGLQVPARMQVVQSTRAPGFSYADRSVRIHSSGQYDLNMAKLDLIGLNGQIVTRLPFSKAGVAVIPARIRSGTYVARVNYLASTLGVFRMTLQ